MLDITVITIVLAIVAFFYSSVGHGGASGYIAVLTLAGMSSTFIKPSALILNILVAGVSFIGYYKNKHFNLKLFYPFIILSIPMAYLGSYIELNNVLYKQIVGVILAFSVVRIVFPGRKNNIEPKKINLPLALVIGALIGLLSGMIGMGGGIILSPIILLLNWGSIKETAAVSSLFIVLNSVAGLIGLYHQSIHLGREIFWWIPATVIAGILGAYWGNKHAGNFALKLVMSAVLLFASIKLIFI